MGLISCSSLERSRDSGYYQDSGSSLNSTKQFYSEKYQHEWSKSKADLGLKSSRPLSESEQVNIEKHMRLNRLESQLDTKREKEQYYSLKPYLPTEDHKIYFLQLPNVEARNRWAITNGFTESTTKYTPREIAAIENNDIIKGMTKKGVIESWGEPDSIEVSGDPLYGNERWLYLKYISSPEGYSKENRVLYFNSGRVSGWRRE